MFVTKQIILREKLQKHILFILRKKHAQNRAFDHFCRKQQQLADVCEQTLEEKARNRLKLTLSV